MKCRNCRSTKLHSIINLGASPASNAYLEEQDLLSSEVHTPLEVLRCEDCNLVQTRDFFSSDDLFTADYAYLSSASAAWLNHCATYCSMITEKLNLNESSLVCEVASNDGYLLTNFINAGIPCFGIEPTKAAANIAEGKGVPTIIEFLGEDTGKKVAAARGKRT